MNTNTNCLCQKSLQNLYTLKQTLTSPIIQCQMCGTFFHQNCVKITQQHILEKFICPDCILNNLDPLHKIRKVLCEPLVFRPTLQNFQVRMTFEVEDAIDFVEIRCIKIDGTNAADDITWPDIGDLMLNGRTVLSFIPMQANSSQKKRKDSKHTFNNYLVGQTNTLILSEGFPNAEQKLNARVTLGSIYYLGVFLVEKTQPLRFIREIQDNGQCLLSKAKSIDFALRHFNNKSSDNSEVQIKSVLVSLTCTLDTLLMQTPARGELCDHLQCFSLENMINIMTTIKPRRWRCPICKSRCYKFIIDEYQLELINEIKEKKLPTQQIIFNQDGSTEWVMQPPNQQHQNQGSCPSRQNSLKIIESKVINFRHIQKSNHSKIIDLASSSDEDQKAAINITIPSNQTSNTLGHEHFSQLQMIEQSADLIDEPMLIKKVCTDSNSQFVQSGAIENPMNTIEDKKYDIYRDTQNLLHQQFEMQNKQKPENMTPDKLENFPKSALVLPPPIKPPSAQVLNMIDQLRKLSLVFQKNNKNKTLGCLNAPILID